MRKKVLEGQCLMKHRSLQSRREKEFRFKRDGKCVTSHVARSPRPEQGRTQQGSDDFGK